MSKRGCAVTVVLTLLAACGEAATTPRASASPELLFLRRSGAGLVVVSSDATKPLYRSRAVPAADWSTVVHERWMRRNTVITGTDPVTGDDVWEHEVPPGLRVKLVSDNGGLVAMGSFSERPHAAGRRHTRLTIAGPRAPETRTYELEGNYEPEAFSVDGRNLFVIRFMPARDPTSYQVRRLDLTSGEVLPVYTPDAHLQERMGGTARVQAASRDGSRLYTLYTTPGPNGTRYAFIHVLSLDGLWAHCIDLPPEFAQAAERSTAITVSPDGDRVYVVNSTAGKMAEIDADSLKVVRVASVKLDTGSGAHATTSTDGKTIYFTSGVTAASVDANTLEVTNDWEMFESIMGVQAGDDRLYLGLRRTIVEIDTRTGDELETIDPPGIYWIAEFGPVVPSVETGTLTCGC